MKSRFHHVLAAIILLAGSVCGKGENAPLLLATAPSGAFRLLWSGKGTPVLLVPVQATQPAEPLPAVQINDLDRTGIQLDSSDDLNSPPLTFISPDERWIFVKRIVAYGDASILYRRADASGPQGLPRYLPAAAGRLDTLAWQFYSKETKVPMDDIRKPRESMEIQFGGWSADSGRLLLGLRRTNNMSTPLWCCYFNIKTQTFEQTGRLSAAAQTNPYSEEAGVLNPESIGQEGPEPPARERFTKADTELNRIYSELLPKLTPPAQTKLRSEQRQWLIERDTFASIHAIQSWSLHPGASWIEGQAIITERRTAELGKLLTE